ncbi:hypothetical protein STANM309S_03743 [Streptomyces tanashiensis]
MRVSSSLSAMIPSMSRARASAISSRCASSGGFSRRTPEE